MEEWRLWRVKLFEELGSRAASTLNLTFMKQIMKGFDIIEINADLLYLSEVATAW